MSVTDVLAASPAAPADVVLATPERVWTRADLERDVDRRASVLRDGGAAGAVVPCVIEPDADGVIELLALWRAGATPAPLGPSLTAGERDAAALTLRTVTPSAAQAVLWTSGTAGRPRGVALSFAGLEANAAASRERLGLSGRDAWMAALSPAHVGGLALITRALLLGCRLVALGRFEATRAWNAIRGGQGESLRPTHVSVVPTQLLRLIEVSGGVAPPETLRCVLVGGAGTPRDLLLRALDRGWPLALTYGLTQATSQVATAPPAATRAKPGSVGRPLSGVEVRIARDGEILVRGATLASGYFGERGDPLLDGEGWHHTGDLGRVDEEGDLWILGRRVDRIVSGGVTVDAVEVEEALRSHPLVADACVVGVPDETWGERVAAWIEPRVSPSGTPVDLDDIDADMKRRLAAPKRPRLYHVGDGIPRNANGKADRVRVRELLSRASEQATG